MSGFATWVRHRDRPWSYTKPGEEHMSTARHLTWLVPGNDWEETVQERHGKGRKVTTRTVKKTVGPRQFDRSHDAYKHARDCQIPLRLIKSSFVRVGS